VPGIFALPAEAQYNLGNSSEGFASTVLNQVRRPPIRRLGENHLLANVLRLSRSQPMKTYACLLSCTLVGLLVNSSAAAIVFDTITNGDVTSGGFYLSSELITEAGLVVNLDGTDRRIQQVDLSLNHGSLFDPFSFDYRVNFYTAQGTPGNLIWSSPTYAANLPPLNPQILSVSVPGVQVPDMFAITVEKASDTATSALLSWWSTPPIVGTTFQLLENADGTKVGDGWRRRTIQIPGSIGGFGFRIFAVPEPTTSAMLGLALIAIAGHTRTRRSPSSGL
jgi:hypothetical protein